MAPQDAGVASATVTVGQQLGASMVQFRPANTIFASAVASYLTLHIASARLIGRGALAGLALSHGYDTAFWWIAGIFAGGAIVGGLLFRSPRSAVPQGRPGAAGRRGHGGNRGGPGPADLRPRPRHAPDAESRSASGAFAMLPGKPTAFVSKHSAHSRAAIGSAGSVPWVTARLPGRAAARACRA